MAKSRRSKKAKGRSLARTKLIKNYKKKIDEFFRDYKPNPEMMKDGKFKPIVDTNPNQTSIYNPNGGASICLPGVRAKDFEI